MKKSTVVIILLVLVILALLAKLDDQKNEAAGRLSEPTGAEQSSTNKSRKSIAQDVPELNRSLEDLNSAKAELRKSWADVKSEFRKGLNKSLGDSAAPKPDKAPTPAPPRQTTSDPRVQRLVRKTVEQGLCEGKTETEMAVDLIMNAAASGVASGLVDISKQGMKDCGVSSEDVRAAVEACKKIKSFKRDTMDAALDEIRAELEKAAKPD